MKNLKRIALFLIMATMFVGFIGCKQEETPPAKEPTEEGDSSDTTDTTELPEVTNLTVNETDGKLILNWKNPKNENIRGVLISSNPPEGSLREPHFLLGNEESFEVEGLRNGIEYTFTIKTILSIEKYSTGVSKKHTPSTVIEETSLIPSTTEITQDPITVKVKLKSGTQAKKIYYSDYIYSTKEQYYETYLDNPEQYLLKDITETKEFRVEQNNRYYVLIQNQQSQCKLLYIDILNLDAIITDIYIPNVGTNYAGKEVLVTMKGDRFNNNTSVSFAKNFVFNKENISFEGIEVDPSTIKIFDKNTISAQIKCPSEIGTTEVTVKYGKTSAKTTFEVVQSKENEYKVGDIVLKDKTIVPAEIAPVYTYDENKKPIGIVAMTENVYGVPETKIIGTKNKEKVSWGKDIDIELKTYYEELAGGSQHIFGGNLDGSNVWEEICKIDAENSQNAEKNYRIFDFANNYAKNADLVGTEYENGWYIPSIAEVYYIFQNKKEIQSSLNALGEYNLINYDYYFSSSSYSKTNAYTMYFDYNKEDIYIAKETKKSSVSVFVLKKLNLEDFEYVKDFDTEIYDVEIPTIAKGFVGEVPITVKGKNLFLSLNSQELSVEGLNPIRVENITTEKARIYVKTTGSESNGDIITVGCRNSSKTGILKVVEAENVLKIGDIVLADGTTVSDSEYSDNQENRSIGTIVDVLYGGGTGKFMGAARRIRECWAKENTTGYETSFKELQIKYSSIGNNEYEFYGDLDGSDNWEIICRKDPVGTQDSENNYPIFYKANTYAETNNLTETKFSDGWYIPSIAELYQINKNLDLPTPLWSSSLPLYKDSYQKKEAIQLQQKFSSLVDSISIEDIYKKETGYVIFLNTIGAGC